MANILKGIDKIETVAGTVVDLDNIQATGASGSTSSTSLGFTRSEDANSIYYDMGETIYKSADGHSVSASDHFTFGGWGTSAEGSSAKISYSSGANHDGWAMDAAASATGHVYSTGASSGDSFLRLGGYTGSQNISQTNKYSLTTSGTSNGWAGLVSAVRSAGGAGDGEHALMMAGRDNNDTRNIQRLSFSDNTYAEYWANGINNSTDAGNAGHRSNGYGTSDGTNAFCVGGAGSSMFLKDIQTMSFSDSSIDSSTHGTLDVGRTYTATGSDGSDAFTVSGQLGTGQYDRNCVKWSLTTAGTNAATFVTLSRCYAQCGASSSGDDMMASGGYDGITGALFGDCTKISLSSYATDESFSSSRTAHSPAYCSGTSA